MQTEKIFDPHTLISRKYFSIASRSNHSTDLLHDKANLFPESSAFEKPSCKTFHKRRNSHTFPNKLIVRKIAKLYLPTSNAITGNEGEDPEFLPKVNELKLLREKQREKEKQKEKEKKIERKTKGSKDKTKKRERLPKENNIRSHSFSQYGGKSKTFRCEEIVERSKQLIQDMETPEELFERITLSRQNDLKNHQRNEKQEREKLEKLAKRLDITLPFETNSILFISTP